MSQKRYIFFETHPTIFETVEFFQRQIQRLAKQIRNVARQVLQAEGAMNRKDSFPVDTEKTPDMVLAFDELHLKLEHHAPCFFGRELHLILLVI